jgi:hypothetical protein
VNLEGRVILEENVSAEKAPAQEGAWLPQKNEDQKRQEGTCREERKGQSQAKPLVNSYRLDSAAGSSIKACGY